MDNFINTKEVELKYYEEPSAIYEYLCKDKKNTLLLESAQIGTKNSIKSILLTNAALKIICNDKKINFIALNKNGEKILPLIQNELKHISKINLINSLNLQADFLPNNPNLDEYSKLLSPDIFDGLRSINKLYKHSKIPVFLGGLFSYDLIMNIIDMDKISLNNDEIKCPDYVFYLADNLIIIDHQYKKSILQSFVFDENINPNSQINEICEKLNNFKNGIYNKNTIIKNSKIDVNLNDEEFKSIIEKIKQYLNDGDIFQIVPSRRFIIPCSNPLDSYNTLKTNNPSPYMFYMQDDDFILFGTSPESSLKYSTKNKEIEIYPIAGSRPRGFDENGEIDQELDSKIELELRLDEKEITEHLMLVDLARNDIARICKNGTRQIKKLMQIDKYSHVMHLVSMISGKLDDKYDALHAYKACMNMGTLTGTPKIRAMELIYKFEKQKRHSYGGAIGYLNSNGDLDTCIVIRSAFVQNEIAYIQAGCGVILESDAQKEADETRHKARAVIKAIDPNQNF